MLPKPEKIRKNQESESPKADDPVFLAQRAKNKRRLVLLSLIFTVGLNFIFWTYRFLKNNFQDISLPKFNLNFQLPSMELSNNISVDIDSKIAKLISPSPESWSFLVASLPSQEILWQKNFKEQDIDSIIKKISSSSAKTESQLETNLPQGLSFQEIISESPDFNYQSIITTPSQKLLVLIKGESSQNISPKDIAPQLINQIYWESVKSLN